MSKIGLRSGFLTGGVNMFQNISMKQTIFRAFITVMEGKVPEAKAATRLSNGREMIWSVSVTEITRQAHINRRTFYTYFHDVYDLFDQLEDKYADDLDQLIQGWEDQSDPMRAISESVGKVVDYMSQNSRGMKLVSTIDTTIFTMMIQNNVKRAITIFNDLFDQGRLGPKVTPDRKWEFDYTVIFLTSGFAWVCYDWLKHPDEFPKEKLKQLISSTFMGAYKLVQSDELLNPSQLQEVFQKQRAAVKCD